MKKVLFYIAFYLIGFIWMGCGIMALGFVGAADGGAPMLPNYIKAVLLGCVSFGCLVVLQNMMWEM